MAFCALMDHILDEGVAILPEIERVGESGRLLCVSTLSSHIASRQLVFELCNVPYNHDKPEKRLSQAVAKVCR